MYKASALCSCMLPSICPALDFGNLFMASVLKSLLIYFEAYISCVCTLLGLTPIQMLKLIIPPLIVCPNKSFLHFTRIQILTIKISFSL